jgi:hypothetical protein
MKHKVKYTKWVSKIDPDQSLRYFQVFDDRPEFTNTYVLKTHSTKEYTIIPERALDEYVMQLFHEAQYIEGYYENKQYVKIIDGVKVTEPTHQTKKGKDMTHTDTIFWMVYGKDKGTPKTKHYTQEAAVLEAKRLSLTTPGVVYYVLRSVDAYVVTLPEPQKVDLSSTLQNL